MPSKKSANLYTNHLKCRAYGRSVAGQRQVSPGTLHAAVSSGKVSAICGEFARAAN